MELNFNLVGSATWVMEIDNKFKIGCDPALAKAGTKYIYKGLKTSRVKAPVYDNHTFDNVKLWVVTHGHFDHIDKEGLQVIENSSKVVSHKNAAKLLNKKENIATTYLNWHEKKSFIINGYIIEIEAIPAIHGMNLLAKVLMGDVNGYLITIDKGIERKTIYVTSDAVYSEDIVKALEGRKVDILIANLGQAKSRMIGGPFTMNIDMLNKFIIALSPKVVLPIHTNDFAHFETTKADLDRVIKKHSVAILENGENITIPEEIK